MSEIVKLVAVLCSIHAPYHCQERTVTTAISMSACATIAVTGLPTWAAQFPAYELQGWTCKQGGKATEREA